MCAGKVVKLCTCVGVCACELNIYIFLYTDNTYTHILVYFNRFFVSFFNFCTKLIFLYSLPWCKIFSQLFLNFCFVFRNRNKQFFNSLFFIFFNKLLHIFLIFFALLLSPSFYRRNLRIFSKKNLDFLKNLQ